MNRQIKILSVIAVVSGVLERTGGRFFCVGV